MREHGNPYWIGFALNGYGRTYCDTDPDRALAAWREGLDHVRRHRIRYVEGFITIELASLEAVHGELDEGLGLFDTAIEMFHRAGDTSGLAQTLASLAVYFETSGRSELAATVYGAATRDAFIDLTTNLADCVDHLREELGETHFGDAVAVGAAMDLADAVHFARDLIRATRQSARATPTGTPTNT